MLNPMDFFYSPPPLVTPPSILIDGDEFSHLSHVMRKKEHDAICVVDGCGNLYETVITSVSRRSATCTIVSHKVRVNEPDREVTLASAILKHANDFDFLVEKATELGVRSIVPLSTERTIPRSAKVERWHKLALAAMKQSQRCVLPTIHPLTAFTEFVRRDDSPAIRLIPHEKTLQPALRDAVPAGTSHVVVVIGPEGGFTDEEVEMAARQGYIPVSLGPRRLRAETAAIVAVAETLLSSFSVSRI